MKRGWRLTFLAFLGAIALSASGATSAGVRPQPTKMLQLPPAPSFDGMAAFPVLKVVDGDTVIVERDTGPVTVRLLGVDTPEVLDPRVGVQFYGREASAFTYNLLAGESVFLVEEQPGEKDQYGRTLAHLYRAPDGLWVNLELVRQGYAQVYSGRAVKDADVFLEAQRRAQEFEKGLWSPAKDAETGRPPSTPNSLTPTPERRPEPQQVTVYVTRTGTKYHRAGCSYLKSSSIPMSLENARARYGPCSRCNPPS